MTTSPKSKHASLNFPTPSAMRLAAITLAIAASLSAAPLRAEAAKSSTPDRANSYYHFALAHTYEEMATTYGRPEYATRAIEEYKLALNADPESPYLNSGLAELYFKTGRVRDAVLAAQDMIKKDPNSLEAHKLLGRIYLRSLGDVQNNSPSEKMLDLAISEYSKIVELAPNDIENRLLLGQLYSLDHNTAKAEEQFKTAQKIDPNSEDVVLNLARLYTDSGDLQHAAAVLTSVPVEDRTAKMEYALGSTYDQLKDNKKAIAAYQRSIDNDPDNLDAERALAQSLLNDNQLEQALKIYMDISAGDPQDPQAYLRISEIERRQGKYEQSLGTLKKAKALVKDSLEISFNEALLYDSMGRYDDATQILEKLVASTAHANDQYSELEKNNRAIFLERLANVYREENKTPQAIDSYNKMIAMGGDFAERGYQSKVDAYRDARMYTQATAAAQDAAQKLPKDRQIKLMLAGQLADSGKVDEGLALAKSQLNGTPDDRETYLQLAQIDIRLRRWKDASDALDKAEPLATKQEEKIYVYFLRGTIAERQKHYDAAEEQFHKILALDANNSMTLNYLGYMLADRGVRLPEAVKILQQAVLLDPQNGAYLDSLGWAYFKLGQYGPAEEYLRKALERLSTDPSVHDHMGELYDKTGRLKDAAAQWELALKEYARSSPADAEPGDVSKVEKKLEGARVRLAKHETTVSGKN
ncbi:MAG TPA: tetratricopeptide repeat protein [Acidisarcina sp.]|nr:tetratricopeptide repeat protein [Acidisarcina sp.]